VAAEPAGTIENVIGATLGSPVRRGEPITDARLRGATLLAQAGRDLRAVVIRLGGPTAGWLRSGDRVDVVAGGSASGLPGEALSPRVIASDTLVLAVGSADAAAAGDGSTALGLGDTSGTGGTAAPGEGDLVVLAAGPSQAVALAAAGVGSPLNVVIRPPDR
jgi:Flp pilus assembly protein CpaB